MPDVKELADRPALNVEEIEVTPEMIEAGRDIIASVVVDEWDHRLDGEIVKRVFVAMAGTFYRR
jgi:hypothetical protein